MSFSEDGNMVMPVAPAYGGGNGGFGCGWGDSAWWLIIILFALGGFGGYGMGGFGGGLGYDFPWLLNGQNGILNGVNANTNAGFANAAIQGSIGDLSTAVTAGFGNVQNSLCSGFAGVNASVNNAQNAISNQLYTNQISDLERSFAAQTANTQAISGISSQLAQCCCDNRLATCQTQNIVQNEGNATRFADANNTRDIIDAINTKAQGIQDKLCQLELDGKETRIRELESQLNEANRNASQNAQNALIAQGFANEVDQLYNRLNSCPIPSTPVFGRTAIFSCNNGGYNVGCGCGM